MANIPYKYLASEKTRHGKNVWYVRLKIDGKYKRVRLHETPGTTDFTAEYHAARKRLGSPTPATVAVQRESLQWLVNKYYQSAKFQVKYAEATRRQQRNILDRICEAHGAKSYKQLTSKNIRAGRDARAKTPGAANNYLKTLKALFTWAMTEEYLETNPAAGVERVSPKNSDGHHTWTPEERQAFEDHHPLGTTARLAYALILYAGPRRSDLVKLGHQHITAEGTLAFNQYKRDGTLLQRVELPILRPLQEAIDALPEKRTHFIQTAYGNPFTANGFGNKMKVWTKQAGLPCRCTSHGIRKALGALLAESGATENEIAAALGHSDTKSAQIYTKKARQKRLAAAAMRTLQEKSVAPGTTPDGQVRQNREKR